MGVSIIPRLIYLTLIVTVVSLAAGMQQYSMIQVLALAVLLLYCVFAVISEYNSEFFIPGFLLVLFLASLILSYMLPKPFFGVPLFASGLGAVMILFSMVLPNEAPKDTLEKKEKEPDHTVIVEHIPEMTPEQIDEKLFPYVASAKGKLYHVAECPLIKRVGKKNRVHLDTYKARKMNMEPCVCVKVFT